MGAMRKLLSICLLFLLLAIASPQPPTVAAQDAELVSRMLAAINSARVANGLPPYALNPLLTQAAQRHSEYQRDIGQVTHDGPGGTRALDRVLAVGYPATRANENILSMMNTSPEEAVTWWLTADEAHRNNILHPVLREIGIGTAMGDYGRIYYTMDISAQPNVLPIFINDGAALTDSPDVTLTLWNEGVFGSAAGRIGRATQIMVSHSPDFAGATTQPWTQYVEWTLDTSGGEGQKTIYVRFIDAAGNTADSQDSILFAPGAEGAPTGDVTPSPLPTFAPSPTDAPQQPALPPTTLPPTITPGASSAPTEAAPTRTVSATPTRSVTRIPSPTASPTPPVELLGLPLTSLRSILVGMLAVGLSAILIGTLAMIRSSKHTVAPKEEESDGND